jgi:hypothetical protein
MTGVAKMIGEDSKAVSKVISELKKQGKVTSPKRCYYQPSYPQASEVRRQRSEDRGRKTEVRRQRTEVRGQIKSGKIRRCICPLYSDA